MDRIPILVLDDQPDITRLTSFVLEKHGYEVTVSNMPSEALAVAEKKTFRLILVDFMMPEMSGLDFIRKVKAIPSNAAARFIILTAKKINDNEMREIFELNADLIQKPFVPLKLAEKVNSSLQ